MKTLEFRCHHSFLTFVTYKRNYMPTINHAPNPVSMFQTITIINTIKSTIKICWKGCAMFLVWTSFSSELCGYCNIYTSATIPLPWDSFFLFKSLMVVWMVEITSFKCSQALMTWTLNKYDDMFHMVSNEFEMFAGLRDFPERRLDWMVKTTGEIDA